MFSPWPTFVFLWWLNLGLRCSPSPVVPDGSAEPGPPLSFGISVEPALGMGELMLGMDELELVMDDSPGSSNSQMSSKSKLRCKRYIGVKFTLNKGTVPWDFLTQFFLGWWKNFQKSHGKVPLTLFSRFSQFLFFSYQYDAGGKCRQVGEN